MVVCVWGTRSEPTHKVSLSCAHLGLCCVLIAKSSTSLNSRAGQPCQAGRLDTCTRAPCQRPWPHVGRPARGPAKLRLEKLYVMFNCSTIGQLPCQLREPQAARWLLHASWRSSSSRCLRLPDSWRLPIYGNEADSSFVATCDYFFESNLRASSTVHHHSLGLNIFTTSSCKKWVRDHAHGASPSHAPAPEHRHDLIHRQRSRQRPRASAKQ